MKAILTPLSVLTARKYSHDRKSFLIVSEGPPIGTVNQIQHLHMYQPNFQSSLKTIVLPINATLRRSHQKPHVHSVHSPESQAADRTS